MPGPRAAAALTALASAATLVAGTSGSQAASRAGPDATRVDNGLIALSRASEYGMYVIDLDRGSGLRLFSKKGSWPSWSPDGRRIAFHIWKGHTSIWVMDASGRNRRKVIENGGRPDWSPDGKQLVYLRLRGVYVATAGGRKRHRIMGDPRHGFRFVDWSPGGGAMVVSSYDDYGTHQEHSHVATETGRILHELNPEHPEAFAWDPDGRYLATVTCAPGSGNIVLLETTNWSPVRTLPVRSCPRRLAWAPDGASIASCGLRGLERVWLADSRVTAIPAEAWCDSGFSWGRTPG